MVLPGKRWLRQVFALYVLYVQEPSLSFADCSHAVFMRRYGLSMIGSFDQEFDRLPRITRREPQMLTDEEADEQ